MSEHSHVGGVSQPSEPGRATIGSACGDPLAIDGPWMTEALEAAGVARGATVTDVEFDGFIGTGQMSRNARYGLTWDRPDGRPATVVGKFPSHDESTKLSSFGSGAYHHEYAFYADVAPTVAIRTPACWVARFDADAPDFVLIMEDMAGSAQGDQFSEPPADVVRLAIEQAAGLHGPRWGDPTLATEPAMQYPGGDRGSVIDQYWPMAVEVCITRLGHNLDDDIQQLIRDFGDLLPAYCAGDRDAGHDRPRRLPPGQLPDRSDAGGDAAGRRRLADRRARARRGRRRLLHRRGVRAGAAGARSSEACWRTTAPS